MSLSLVSLINDADIDLIPLSLAESAGYEFSQLEDYFWSRSDRLWETVEC